MSRTSSPPILPRLFLRLLLSKVLTEQVTGDMNESYARDVATRGLAFARWMYLEGGSIGQHAASSSGEH